MRTSIFVEKGAFPGKCDGVVGGHGSGWSEHRRAVFGLEVVDPSEGLPQQAFLGFGFAFGAGGR